MYVCPNRIGKLGILSVKLIGSDRPAASIEHSAASDNITIDITKDTDVFIGGVPDYYLVGVLSLTCVYMYTLCYLIYARFCHITVFLSNH